MIVLQKIGGLTILERRKDRKAMQYPQQWQYCFLNVRETGRAIDYCDGNGDQEDRRPVTQIVSYLGQQGWELVSVVNFTPMISEP